MTFHLNETGKSEIQEALDTLNTGTVNFGRHGDSTDLYYREIEFFAYRFDVALPSARFDEKPRCLNTTRRIRPIRGGLSYRKN